MGIFVRVANKKQPAPGGSFTIPFLGANEELRLQTLLEDHDLLGGPNEGHDHKDIYWANFEPGIMGLAAQPGQANLHALPYYAPFPAAERAYYDSLGMLAGTAQSLALGQIAINQHESAKAEENADWERMNQAEISAENAKYLINAGLDNLVANPKQLGLSSPNDFYRALQSSNYNVTSLSKGGTQGISFEQGGGFKVNWGGDKLFQYHPAGLNHHYGFFATITKTFPPSSFFPSSSSKSPTIAAAVCSARLNSWI